MASLEAVHPTPMRVLEKKQKYYAESMEILAKYLEDYADKSSYIHAKSMYDRFTSAIEILKHHGTT